MFHSVPLQVTCGRSGPITGAWVPQSPFLTFLKSPFFKFPSKIPVEQPHFELRWSNRNPIYPPV